MTDTPELTGPADPTRPAEGTGPAEAATAAPRSRRRATSGGLAAMVLPELQAMAGDLGITGVGRLRKGELIEAIQARRTGGAAAADAAGAAGPAEGAGGPAEPAGEAGEADGTQTGPRERPERIDRGRERFLEREARRQERAAQQAGGEPQREATSRTGPDRTGPDRPGPDRTAEQRDGDGRFGEADDRGDDDGGRRGRYRERGRRRGNGRDRYGSDGEPVLGEDDVLIPVGGILDILDNYAFVRTTGYLTGANDVYVSLSQVRRYALRRGDAVTGAVRQPREGERRDKYNALVRLDTVNGMDPEDARTRPDFGKLTPLYPQERLRLETDPGQLTTRVIDLVMPIGKGQRALVVSPPRAGKTLVLQAVANAVTANNPECHLMVVLVDERPEEVTDMQRSVKGEVIASTFDRPPADHVTVAELAIERAKRLVELGHDVVVLLDSITRLGRAYNLTAPASGRVLTGGVDSAALYPAKRFLGAARNIENGGSLTLVATALVDTGAEMDSVVFEEFKGTGNAELRLDRRLADKGIFPAVDVDGSGTRKEELLLTPDELRVVRTLRRTLHAAESTTAVELLLDRLRGSRSNAEFLLGVQRSAAADAAR